MCDCCSTEKYELDGGLANTGDGFADSVIVHSEVPWLIFEFTFDVVCIDGLGRLVADAGLELTGGQ